MNALEKTKKLYAALQELAKSDGEFLNADIESENFSIKLYYERKEFISDIKKALSLFDENKQNDITGFFGFVLEQHQDFTSLRGYPSIENIDHDEIVAYSNIYHYVKRFVSQNKIYIESYPNISKCLSIIAEIFPELYTIAGKIQHHTHSYSVDIHTLKVLQGVLLNPAFKKLPENDKYAIEIAVLMHDITKKEGEIDKSHPACSAKDAYFILNKIEIPENEKIKICNLIKNHDWLERYNKGITSAKEFAQTLKEGNNFEMLCIIAEADLKAVQRGGTFFEKYGDVLKEGQKEISSILNNDVPAA